MRPLRALAAAATALLGVSLTGCSPRPGSALSPQLTAAEVRDMPSSVEVITDPAEIRAARKLAAAQAKEDRRQDDELLVLMSSSNAEGLERLRRERDRIVPHLRRQLANRDPAASWQRAKAAFTLLRLDDPAGTAAARAMLNDPAMVRSALGHMSDLSPADLTKLPGLEGTLLKHLGSKDQAIRRNAIGVAATVGSPALVRRLFEIMRAGEDPQGLAAMGLANKHPSRELLELCITNLRKAGPDDRYWWLFAIAQHARTKAEFAGQAVEECVSALGQTQSALGMDGGMMEALDVVEKHSGPRAVSLLKELTTNPGASSLIRGSALDALARRDPRQGREAALGLLSTPDLADSAAAVLGRVGRGSADGALVQALTQVAQRAGKDSALKGTAGRALLSIGGEPALQAAVAIADDLPAADQTAVRWAEHAITPQKALLRLLALKVIDERGAARARAKLAAAPQRATGGAAPTGDVVEVSLDNPGVVDDLPGPGFLESALDAAGLLASFDTETGELPVRHDKLLMELAACSGGGFKPEAAYERWERKSEEDEEAPYLVQFIHAGRLYRVQAQNLGDWYDVEAVLAVANRALADAGASRRFVPLVGDGQMAAIAFVVPATLEAASRELYLPGGGDPDAARQAGKAFEGEVIEGLRKRKE